jgi:DNA polymerase III sliding clamp (beta) subunit (PCNA family)
MKLMNIEIDRQSLIAAIKKLKGFVATRNAAQPLLQYVVCQATDECLQLIAFNGDQGGMISLSQGYVMNVEGKVSFAPDRLVSYLSQIDADDVCLQQHSPAEFSIITPNDVIKYQIATTDIQDLLPNIGRPDTLETISFNGHFLSGLNQAAMLTMADTDSKGNAKAPEPFMGAELQIDQPSNTLTVTSLDSVGGLRAEFKLTRSTASTSMLLNRETARNMFALFKNSVAQSFDFNTENEHGLIEFFCGNAYMITRKFEPKGLNELPDQYKSFFDFDGEITINVDPAQLLKAIGKIQVTGCVYTQFEFLTSVLNVKTIYKSTTLGSYDAAKSALESEAFPGSSCSGETFCTATSVISDYLKAINAITPFIDDPDDEEYEQIEINYKNEQVMKLHYKNCTAFIIGCVVI